MKVGELIQNLQSASKGSRTLDGQIAQVLGWARRTETFMDKESSETKVRELWLLPDSQEPGKVPHYTSNLHHAYDLAAMISPSDVGGFSWEKGKASAQIGLDQPIVQAGTPMLAICIAALNIYASRRGDARP